MVVNINHFETLRERFPEWSNLEKHLTSKEGGALRVVAASEGTPGLRVIRYVDGSSQSAGTGLFRSVVWDTVENRPVCFAPPKAKEGSPPLQTAFSSVEDFLDGVMVNAFVCLSEPTVLHIATRTQLGGNNTFYTEKTFAQMFDDGLASTPVRTREILLMHLREAMNTAGSTSAFASFVVQHPDHRIVTKLVSADVHMVHMGTVSETGAVTLLEQSSQWPAPMRRLQIPRYPVKAFHSESEMTDLMRRTAVQNGFRWQGLVFKDGLGTRWRLRSTPYMAVRSLRGSEATPVERFLRLRRDGKVKEYLRTFGEERQTFWDLETKLREQTQVAFKAYEAVHKSHAMKFADLPVGYKPAVHLLHVEYLGSLRAAKRSVQPGNAIKVVNDLRNFEQRRLLEAPALVVPEVLPTEIHAAWAGLKDTIVAAEVVETVTSSTKVK